MCSLKIEVGWEAIKKKKASRFSCEIVFCSYELNTLSEKFQKETGKNVFALILHVECSLLQMPFNLETLLKSLFEST